VYKMYKHDYFFKPKTKKCQSLFGVRFHDVMYFKINAKAKNDQEWGFIRLRKI